MQMTAVLAGRAAFAAVLAACLAPAAARAEFERVRPDELLREPLGAVVFKSDFGDPSEWKTRSYNNRLEVRVGGDTPLGDRVLYVASTTNKSDSAWACELAAARPIGRKAAAYVFSVEISSSRELYRPMSAGSGWTSSITWLGQGGKVVASHPLQLRVPRSGGFRRVWIVDSIPDGAEKFTLQLGFDNPDLKDKNFIAFRRLVLGVTDATWACRKDARPPRVRLLTPSPTADPHCALKVSITDATMVRRGSVKISVDGRDETGNFTSDGGVWTLGGSHEWTNGIHRVDVTAADWFGNCYTANKIFFVGEGPKPGAGRVEVRADGKFLADGKPFFPVGLYAVSRREFNGKDLDNAFKVIKAAGFNAVHSYGLGRDPEFLSMASKYGMKAWTAYKAGAWSEVVLPGEEFVSRLRHEPSTLAWYIGDDTSSYQSPEELLDYNDAVKALDPNHLTAQADGVHAEKGEGNYAQYVDCTDVFMPEIYPIRTGSADPDTNCVAAVISDMRHCNECVAKYSGGVPKAILPIIQQFKGWGGWPRYPNEDEETAMTFASVVYGAAGVTWYTYGGFGKNEGVTSTPERWAVASRLAARLSEISPALLSPTVKTPPALVIRGGAKGPMKDTLGNDAISTLVKDAGDAIWVVAVNSRYEKIMAYMQLPGVDGTAEVLWEDRSLPVRGWMIDVFRPFGVHVYRIPKGAPLPPAAEGVVLKPDGKGGFLPIDTVPHDLDILLEGGHVQGVCCSEKRIYLSHKSGLEALDWTGRVVAHIDAPPHLGDTAYADGRIYGALQLCGPAAGDKPGVVRVWDEDFNVVKERRFKARFDGITVMGGHVYVGVDEWSFEEHPHLRVKKLDLDLNEVADVTIPLSFNVHYGVQTMSNDGKSVFCGMYGAAAAKGNPERRNFVEITPGLEFVRAVSFCAAEGFDRVPAKVAGGRDDVYFRVSAMGGNMQGWRADPEGNPPRIRIEFTKLP